MSKPEEKKLQQFVGHLLITKSHSSRVYEQTESIILISANTKAEALGLALDEYPESNAQDWDIYGGVSEEQSVGVIEELLTSGWSA